MVDLQVKKCSDSEQLEKDKVEFGKVGIKDICGTVEGLDEKFKSNAESSTGYTNLFREKGDKSQVSGSDSTKGKDSGRTVCNSFGVIVSSVQGKEIVGFCKEDGSNPIAFIEKTKDSSKVSLKACIGECYDNNQESKTTIKQLENTKGEGKDVKFLKKRN